MTGKTADHRKPFARLNRLQEHAETGERRGRLRFNKSDPKERMHIMRFANIPAVGQATAQKIDFLLAAERHDALFSQGIGVNDRYCRPLHPHGLRLVREGLMSLSRDRVLGRKRRTRLAITEKGREELARLRRKHTGAF